MCKNGLNSRWGPGDGAIYSLMCQQERARHVLGKTKLEQRRFNSGGIGEAGEVIKCDYSEHGAPLEPSVPQIKENKQSALPKHRSVADLQGKTIATCGKGIAIQGGSRPLNNNNNCEGVPYVPGLDRD